MNSILDTIKKALGLDVDDLAFDADVIMDINSAFMILNQLGIGPSEGFSITGNNEVWTDFLGTAINLESVKTYVFIKTRLVFDPPSSSFVIDALDRNAKEIEWRLKTQADPVIPPEEPVEE